MEFWRRFPGGPGPWYCCLLMNMSETCKKQTHVFAHTYPHLAVDRLNQPAQTLLSETHRRRRKRRVEQQQQDACWVMVLMIGRFEAWNDAVAFLHLWMDHTRGKLRRLERGVELFKRYCEHYSLTLWSEDRHRDAIVDAFALPVPPPPLDHPPLLLVDGGDAIDSVDNDGDDDDDDAHRPAKVLRELSLMYCWQQTGDDADEDAALRIGRLRDARLAKETTTRKT